MPAKPAQQQESFLNLLLIGGAILILGALYFSITTSQQNAARGGLAVGQPAPEIVAQGWNNLAGDVPPTYEGKITVVNAWATWCLPCFQHAPEVVELSAQFAEVPEVQFVSMTSNTEAELEAVQKWLSDANWDWPNAYGAETAFQEFEVRFIPAMWIIDQTGTVLWNSANPDDPETVIRQALEK